MANPYINALFGIEPNMSMSPESGPQFTPMPATPVQAAMQQAPAQTKGILSQFAQIPGFNDGLIQAGAGLLAAPDLKTGLAQGFAGFNKGMNDARKLTLEEMKAKKPNLTPTGQPGIFLAVYPDGRQETVVVDEAVKAAAELEDRKDQRQRDQFTQQNTLLDKRLGTMINVAAMKNDKPRVLPSTLQKSEDTDQEAITGYESNVGMIRPVISNLTRGEDGKAPLELGPLKNAYNASRNFFGKSTPESQRYQELEETKTRIVNESLRLNKGTQTEGDAQRAAKELEAAWAKNDTDAARKAFERLEEININAANNKAALINKRRQAQNMDPLYSGPAVSPRAPAGKTSTGVNFTIER